MKGSPGCSPAAWADSRSGHIYHLHLLHRVPDPRQHPLLQVNPSGLSPSPPWKVSSAEWSLRSAHRDPKSLWPTSGCCISVDGSQSAVPIHSWPGRSRDGCCSSSLLSLDWGVRSSPSPLPSICSLVTTHPPEPQPWPCWFLSPPFVCFGLDAGHISLQHRVSLLVASPYCLLGAQGSSPGSLPSSKAPGTGLPCPSPQYYSPSHDLNPARSTLTSQVTSPTWLCFFYKWGPFFVSPFLTGLL